MMGCVDTHAAIWAFLDDPRLGRRARERIAEAPKTRLIVSDIVLLETAVLHSKGRLPDCPLAELLAKIADNFRVIPISPGIARIAVELELAHGDRFDRVIVATAKVHGTPLLTRNRAITDSGVVEIVW
jgi:PIN domain nuclease of toxin-antitoxin system